MRHLTPIARSLAILAITSAGAASWPAAAQHIEPQRPSSTQQRGSIGQPFPGVVKDLEVIGPDRFVITISDRPVGGSEHVEIHTPEGPVGRPFVPDERKVYDIASTHDGRFWVLYYSADEVSESQAPAAGLRLRQFSSDGEPVGEAMLLTGSLLTEPDAFDQPRRGMIIPFQSGAVAVAFTSFVSGTRMHELHLVTFSPDGAEGSTDVLEDRLTHMPTVDALPLADGGAAMAWSSGSPMGENLYLTILQPDGQWSDSVQSIWVSSNGRGRAFNLRLAPITGSDDISVTFTVGDDQLWQRFDQNGVARSGVEVLNSTGALIEPVRIDEGRLVGLAEGLDRPAGLYTVAQGDADLAQVESLNARITAFDEEARDSVVVAVAVPPLPDAAAEAPTFSYLYRIGR
ncbi:MAG TPA: hypothetical protein VGN74_03930 [Brevundimonas sp.]|jgi:hypothetical protein|uniref:hypothetical protein n=1 Tax=Brevundimonas sp. TaxID=1871086 RepID=UPI002E0DC894|nr:hypothetical protein [Brevundimonas sp.]